MGIGGRAVGAERVPGTGQAESAGRTTSTGNVAGVEPAGSTAQAPGPSGKGRVRWPVFAIGQVRSDTWVRMAVISALFAFMLLALPVILSLYFVDAMTQVVVYSIVALGLGVLVGRVGLYSLGQAAVLAIGAWTAARLLFATSLPYPVVLLAAGAITMVLGTVILLPALRLRGLYLALITLMLAGAITVALDTLNFPNGGHGFLGYSANLIHIPPIRRPAIAASDPAFYRYAVVVAALMFLLVLWHVRTRPGRAWVAIRQSEPAALAAGINTTLYKIWAWALASFVTGVAGGLLAGADHYLYSIDFPTQDSITLLAVVLMAGAYSLWGAAVAGLLLQLLPSLFQNWGVSSDWITILFGIGVLQVLTTAPRGLADQVPKDIRRLGRLLRGLARRVALSRARAS
jgi:branched-chain amino acid transport system permease protein